MIEEKRFAVLIDADNISARYIKYILDEISNYGTSTYKRIYADWTKPNTNTWKDVLLQYSVTPMQQYSYTTGKNSTDSALIIDAMDILYSGNVEGVCIVSSDSDFTRLASRLRESGMMVIGMGEQKTPKPFIAACNVFKYLDVLLKSDSPEAADAKTITNDKTETETETEKINIVCEKKNAKNMTSLETIRKTIRKIVSSLSDEGTGTNMADIGNQLTKRYPDFDVRNYKYNKLSSFLADMPSLAIEGQRVFLKSELNKNQKPKSVSNDLKNLIINTIKERNPNNSGVNLGFIYQKINTEYKNFNVRHYGFNKVIDFFNFLDFVTVKSNGTRSPLVYIKDFKPDLKEESKGDNDIIENEIRKILTTAGNNGVYIGTIGKQLTKKHPDFNVKKYGSTNLSAFLRKYDFLEVRVKDKTKNSIWAYLKIDK